MTMHRGIECAPAEELIKAERARQIEIGRTRERDYGRGTELVVAARAYIHVDRNLWPWHQSSWQPRSRVENLLRAGALFLAAEEVFQHAGSDEHAVSASESATHTAWLLQRELDAVDEMRRVKP